MNLFFSFICSFSSVEKLGHAQDLESLRLGPYNWCQKSDTSIAVTYIPLPIREHLAPSEEVSFFYVGFLLPITECLL